MRLRQGYRLVAESHGEKEQAQQKTVNDLARLKSVDKGTDPLFPIRDDLVHRRLAYHSEMRKKRQEAAARRWADVADDPNEPTNQPTIGSSRRWTCAP